MQARDGESPEPASTGIAIGILAGGRSTRMGVDKAWLEFEGKPLLSHVLARFETHPGPRLVAAGSPGRELPELPPGVVPVWDAEPNAGPLRGIEALFAALPGSCDRLFVATCDAPFASGAVVTAFASVLGDAQAVVARTDDRRHGLCALYRRECGAPLRDCLDAGQRRVGSWLAMLALRELDENALRGLGLDSGFLANVNRPEDLDAARRRRPGAT